VLSVLPLITLTQIGVIVGFGVLLDTLLVRRLIVPALVTLLDRRFWWPGELSWRRPVSAPEPISSAKSTVEPSTAFGSYVDNGTCL
jgi:RND superfamily putative drug exporter